MRLKVKPSYGRILCLALFRMLKRNIFSAEKSKLIQKMFIFSVAEFSLMFKQALMELVEMF